MHPRNSVLANRVSKRRDGSRRKPHRLATFTQCFWTTDPGTLSVVFRPAETSRRGARLTAHRTSAHDLGQMTDTMRQVPKNDGGGGVCAGREFISKRTLMSPNPQISRRSPQTRHELHREYAFSQPECQVFLGNNRSRLTNIDRKEGVNHAVLGGCGCSGKAGDRPGYRGAGGRGIGRGRWRQFWKVRQVCRACMAAPMMTRLAGLSQIWYSPMYWMSRPPTPFLKV